MYRNRSYKTGISFIVMIAMAIGLLYPAGAPRAAAAVAILDESFDNGALGQSPAGWTVPNPPAAVPPAPDPFIIGATVAELAGYPGQVLKYEQNGKAAASYNVTRNISGATSKVKLSYKFRAEQLNAAVYLPSLKNSGTVKFALNGGNFSYTKQGESAWTPLAPYEAGRWYEVAVMLDADQGFYDLYLDGTLLLSREPGGLGGPLTSFYLGMYRESIGTVYYDDFLVEAYIAATAATLSQTEYELDEGGTLPLVLQFEPANATVQSASWSSSDPSVASVNSSGVVTGVSAGTATITAQPSEPLPPVTATVTVNEAVRTQGDIMAETFESASPGFAPMGWTIPGKPAAVPPAPNPYVLEATVESIPGEGGQALRLTKNGKSAASYSITRPVSGATSKLLMTYRVKAEQSDAVVYLPSLQNGSQLKFAMNGGQFAYMKSGASAWTNIQPYVSGEWHEVKIMLDADNGEFDLYIDGRLKLSREPGGEGGPVTSFYLGLYKDSIGTVYFDDFHLYSYKAATSAFFDDADYDLAKDATLQLPLRFEPADATVQSATWSSSDPSVATVTESGVVKGIAPGTAVITAQPYENVAAAMAAVHVFQVPITSLHIAELDAPVPQGSRILLNVTAEPAGTTEQRIVWGTEDQSVATVDRYGELTAVGPGTTKVFAENGDGSVRGEADVTVAARQVQHELFVSPDGNDGGAGTLADPYRTIGRAQQQVRALNDNMTGDIVVHLRGGTYILGQELVWRAEDSGSNGYFVHYRGYQGEKAVISGGQTLEGWTSHDAESGIYKAEVGTELNTRQLFVDGVRAVRARSEGGLVMPIKNAGGYVSDDVGMAEWRRVNELEFVYNEHWTNSRAGVAHVEAVDGKAVITMKEPAWGAVTNKGMTSATVPVYYENAYELLDQPGEWYYDKTEGVVYYKPRAWEDLSQAEVVAPVLEKLADISGESADAPVRNVIFEGLSFAYSTWMRPSGDVGHADAQNNHLRYPGSPDVLPDAAITVELANSVSFLGNEFTKLGITAIRMQNGVQNSLMEGNLFYDLSGGAVNVGSPDSNDRNVFHPADHRMIMKNNDIVNNIIHDIGIDYKSAAAVSAGYPVDMDISHNEMYSLPYSGTHLGYGWAKDFDPVTSNVRIQNNHIYDLMGMGLFDGGAIYSIGTTGATAADKNLVSGNYLRNQMDIGAPLYTDEGSAYWKFEHNVIDLRESGDWHSSKRWAQIWAPSIHDIDFVGNYTTEPNFISNGYDNLFDNNAVYPDANWPTEAQEIIANSGPQPAFSELGADAVRRWNLESIILAAGGTAQAVLTASDGKDGAMSQAGSEIYYEVDRENIAQVDDNGVVTGVSSGRAILTAYIVNGSMLRTLKADLFVGDTLAEVRLKGTAGKVAFLEKGATLASEAIGYTAQGNEVELDEATFRSAHPDIASVADDGAVTAHAAGDTVLTLAGKFQGTSIVTHYLLRVTDDAARNDYRLKAETGSADGWYVNPTAVNNVSAVDGTLTVSTPSGGHAIYQGRRYMNEMMEFGLRINGSGGWYALMLGKKDETAGYANDDNYIVVVSAGAIELHRYNGTKRTVIYGNLAGYESLGGDAVPNTMLPLETDHMVRMGTFKEEDGVRIVFEVDGETVFDYLDTAEDALDEPGYIGAIARTGSISITGSEQSVPLAALALELESGAKEWKVGDSDTLKPYAVDEFGGVYEVAPVEAVFSSSNSKVATVGADGVVRALGAGTATLTAEYAGLQASRSLTAVADSGGPGNGGPGNGEPGSGGNGSGAGGDTDGESGGDTGGAQATLDLERDANMAIEEGTDGRASRVVKVKEEALAAAFASMKQGGTVVLSVTGDEPTFVIELPVAAWSSASGDSSIVVNTKLASYRLPLALAEKWRNASVITLTIGQASPEEAGQWTAKLKALGMEQLAEAPVSFELMADGETIADFGDVYVERVLVLNEGSAGEAGKWTAVWLDPDGTPRFAPHAIGVNEEGRVEVRIFMPHNSLYTVIRSLEVDFADMGAHWAREDVELLAGKLVVRGVGSVGGAAAFQPDTEITRAEFATLLTRALGLGEAEAGSAKFRDVVGTEWHAGAIGAASKAGLINGYEDGTFRPGAAITREEMAVMLHRALTFAGGSAGEHGDVSLSQGYADAGEVSAWAEKGLASILKAGIMQGMGNGRLEPGASATRAQSAVMMKRLLQSLGFID